MKGWGWVDDLLCVKYRTIVSESWWHIDDGEHDDVIFHVGAKWWCHFIFIQSVKNLHLTWYARKQTEGHTIPLKKMLDLNLSWYCGCASRFTTNAVLEILVQEKRCIWDFRFRPMHLGVVVPKNRCTFEFPLGEEKTNDAWGFWFGKIDALRGSGSQNLMHLGIPVWSSSRSEKSMHLKVPVRKSMQLGVLVRGFLFEGVPVRKSRCT